MISTVRSAPSMCLDASQPFDLHAFGYRFVGLECVRRHVRAVAAIDDHRLLGAQPSGGARRVHRCIAAAIDHDAPPEHRRRAGLDVVQQASPRRALLPRRGPEYRRAWRACAPMAMKTASKPPACCSASTSSTLWLSDDLDAHRLRCGRSPSSGRRAANDRQGCRNAACRPEAGRPHEFPPYGRAGSDDRRRTVRSDLRRRPGRACRTKAHRPASANSARQQGRRGTARPHECSRRCRDHCGCKRISQG